MSSLEDQDPGTLRLPHPVDPFADRVYDPGQKTLPNPKNWVSFATSEYSKPGDFFSYMDGVREMTLSLNALLEKSEDQTPEDFKESVKDLCVGRQQFLEHIAKFQHPEQAWD